MATLDALEPQSRAIVELLLRQQQGYGELASMLEMPAPRVRERAREALIALAPASARRVDEEWRGQIADYVLRQQTGPEAKATRGHLKRSEAARAWVASLIDSLDPLYGDAERPEIPEPGTDRDGERPRRRGGARRGRAAAGGAAGGAAAAATAEAPEGAPDQAAEPSGDELAAESSPTLEEDSAPTEATAPPTADEELPAEETLPPPVEPRAEPGGPRGLSPEVHAIIRRRRLVAAGVGAAVLVAAIVLAIVLMGGGDEAQRAREGPAGQGQAGAGGRAPQARLVGQAQMRPVGDAGRDVQGVAVIAERAGQYQLLVQARGLQPSGRGSAYEVWLYDSPSDAVSLGGQVTDDRGNLQGAGPLPQNFRQYGFIDISRERIDRNAKHSGSSVLRVPLADVLRGGAAARAGGAGGGR